LFLLSHGFYIPIILLISDMRHGSTPFGALFSRPLSSRLPALATAQAFPFPATVLRTYTGATTKKPTRKKSKTKIRRVQFTDILPQTRLGGRRDLLEHQPLWNAALLDKFIQIIKDRNLPAAVQEYPKVSNILSVTALRAYLNLIDKSFDHESKELLEKAVDRVCGDIIRDRVVFDGLAIQTVLYLLRYLGKYGTAKKLWDWADSHGEPLPLPAYIVAIQILSDPDVNENLDALEAIYHKARESDAGTFAEYHLGHNAVLLNRYAEALPRGINPKSIQLLLAIARARLLHGNWKDGYLAYDSACRLSASRPKFFYEAMLDPGRSRPLPEVYRLARLACKEGIRLSPWKLDLLFGKLSNEQKIEVRSEADLFHVIKHMKASQNLMLANFDAGGQLMHGHVNKILSPLRSLVHPKSSIYSPRDPKWSDFVRAVAESAARLLEKLVPHMDTPAQGPYEVVLRLAVEAQHQKLFYSTLQTLFADGGKPSLIISRILLEASGCFGTLKNIQETWKEVVSITEQHGESIGTLQFQALTRAIKQQHSEAATDFLEIEAAHYNFVLETEYSAATLDSENPVLKVDLSQLQTTIVGIFDSTCQAVDRVASKTTDGPILEHLSTDMSIDLRPLGEEIDLWKIYNEISVDPVHLKPPEYDNVEYYELKEYPHLRKRFQDWVAITELMADAAEHDLSPESAMNGEVGSTKSPNDAKLKKSLSNDEALISTALESSPKFTSFDELRAYVWHLRDLCNTYPLRSVP
jgi:hypothetical protein